MRFVNKEKYYKDYTHKTYGTRDVDFKDETAPPSNTKAINFSDVQDAAGSDLADIHKERSDVTKRGICTDNDPDCCCLCAEYKASPCIGCTGVSNSKGLDNVWLRLTMDYRKSIA